MKPDVFALPSHPIADLFPIMSDPELDTLAADIKANGLRVAIVLDHQGRTIVDGRSRREACQRAGITPKVRYLRRDQDPFDFILSFNVRRRHMDESQRGMVAARLANLPQGARTDLASIEARSGGWMISQVQAAHLFNIGRATVQRAKAVIEGGAPELIKAVDRGRIKLNEAERIAKLPHEQQCEIVALPKTERTAARPVSQARAESPTSVPGPLEPVFVVDRVTALMEQVKKLDLNDLVRFTEQFAAYSLSVATPAPAKPDTREAIAASLICGSPKGECRYSACGSAGRCLAQAAAA